MANYIKLGAASSLPSALNFVASGRKWNLDPDKVRNFLSLFHHLFQGKLHVVSNCSVI